MFLNQSAVLQRGDPFGEDTGIGRIPLKPASHLRQPRWAIVLQILKNSSGNGVQQMGVARTGMEGCPTLAARAQMNAGCEFPWVIGQGLRPNRSGMESDL